MNRPVLLLTTAGLLLTSVVVALAADPVPNITINGSDAVTATQSDTISVSLALDSGGLAGENVDWWLMASTPFGWFYYDAIDGSMIWKPGQSVTYRGPLFSFPSTELFAGSGLPVGNYSFYFGVDTNPDGTLDYDKFYYKTASVAIGSGEVQQCDFSLGHDGKERCFGGIGQQCNGIPLLVPFVPHRDSCLVDGWASIGSIIHDRCCHDTSNLGYACEGPDPFEAVAFGASDACVSEWKEAKANTVCSVFAPLRKWQVSFGPYVAGTYDDTSKNLAAPVCARVNPDPAHSYYMYCSSGGCQTNVDGGVYIRTDTCGEYCNCSPTADANIAGSWSASETVTVSCSVDGGTDTETVSYAAPTNVIQSGSQITWTLGGYDRVGTVNLDSIQASGLFMIPEEGVSFSENVLTITGKVFCGETVYADGTSRLEEIELQGRGNAAGITCDEDGCFNFTCVSLADTAKLSRAGSPAVTNMSAEGDRAAQDGPGISIRKIVQRLKR